MAGPQLSLMGMIVSRASTGETTPKDTILPLGAMLMYLINSRNSNELAMLSSEPHVGEHHFGKLYDGEPTSNTIICRGWALS